MDIERDLETVVAQEKALEFPSFDEASAFALGSRMRDAALKKSLPIIIDIRLWDRQLFYAALPGSAGANGEWARRKFNAVRLYHKSSYRLFLEQGANSRIFPADYGLDPQNHAIAGGAFPVRIPDLGPVGCVAVSGLPQREDHNFVVDMLAAYLDPTDRVPRLSGEAR